MDRTKTIKHGDDVYTFSEDDHVHKLNGKPLNGVTTVLHDTIAKPALVPWAVKCCADWIKEHCFGKPTDDELKLAKRASSEVSKSAAVWGTRVHHACEEWAKSGKFPSDNDILQSVVNFAQFINDNGFKILDTERNVWSKEMWIGGILDLILIREGKVYIADIKTSSGIYDDQFIQMGAYSKCLTELGFLKDYGVDNLTGAIIINLKKDSTMANCSSEALPVMEKAFLNTLELFRARDILDTVTKSQKRGWLFN